MLFRIVAPIAILLAVLGLASQAVAEDDPAAPTDQTAEAGAAGEITPPKPPSPDEAALRAVLKSLAKALQEGDGGQIRHVIYAANPTEKKMVDAMADMAVEIAKLQKAAKKAYGAEQARTLTGDLAAETARIDQATALVEGDKATVSYDAPEPNVDDTEGASPEPMVLRRVDGRWQVPVAELSKGTTPAEIDERLVDLAAQTKVVTALTGEIAAGKYKSADKAAEAWQVKMLAALRPGKPEGENGDKGKEAEGQGGEGDHRGKEATERGTERAK